MTNEITIILNTADKQILIHLYKTYGTPQSLFQLHNEYAFSPAQLGRFVKKLTSIGIIEIQNDNISLTTFGKKWLLSNRNLIFQKSVEYYWRKIPDELQQEKICINSLYKPKTRKLGKHFLEDELTELKNSYRKG